MTTHGKTNYKFDLTIGYYSDGEMHCKVDNTYFPIENKNGKLTFGGDSTASCILSHELSKIDIKLSEEDKMSNKFQQMAIEFRKTLLDNLKIASRSKNKKEFEFETKGYSYDKDGTVHELLTDNHPAQQAFLTA